MKTLLIQVPPKQIIETYDKPKFGFPNIGLAYIAAQLRSKGKDCSVIDARYLGISIEELKNKVAELKPEIIGFSAMTHQIENVANVAKIIREVSSALFLIGGVHATALPKETLERYPVFDAAIFGEGENTTLEIVEALEQKGLLQNIKGVAWRTKEGTIQVNEARPFIENLDSLPFPAWDMFPTMKSYPVLSSRGCPHQCIFCMRVLGSKVRKRSMEKVIQEIQWLNTHFGAYNVGFIDETFTVDHKRIYQFTDLMKQTGLGKKVTWQVETRVDSINEEMLVAMKSAGCTLVQFGVESGNPDILKAIKKGITVEQAEKAVKLAKQQGLKTWSFFILGHPNETRQTMRDTVKLATKLNTKSVAFGIMVPYPGTGIYNMALKGEGGYKVLSDNWQDFNKTVGNSLELSGLTRKELEATQLRAYLHFYLHNWRFKDLALLFFKNWRVGKYYLRKFTKLHKR